MTTRPPNLVYAVNERPPLPRLLALGLQYAVLMSVYLVLIALIARAAGADSATSRNLISFGLVAMAVAISLQACRGRYFGSGFLAPPAFSAIYFAPCLLAAEHGGLPAVGAMTIVAGVSEIVLSQLIQRLRVVFQPLISGFTVFVVGIQLGLVSARHLLDISAGGQAGFGWSVAAGGLTLAVGVGLSVWGHGIWRLTSTLIALLAGTAFAVVTGVLGASQLATLADASWLAIPDPVYISYRFDWTLAPIFLMTGIAAAIRVVGVITMCQRLNDADWKQPDTANIGRGVLADGLGAVFAGLLGLSGTSAAPSMVGISGATGATSRAIAYSTAGLLLAFALTPKLSAGVLALPAEVAGGILLFSATFMITSGIQIMALHGLDVRSGFSVGAALLLGLTAKLAPDTFSRLPAPLDTMSGDLLTFSLTIAILLILIFRIGIRRSDVVQWRAADAALADFRKSLAKDAKAWALADDVITRAGDTVANVVDRLKRGGLIQDTGVIRSSFDNLELRIEIAYRGRPPDLSAYAGPTLENAHEESAMSSGLGSFSGGAHADRSSVAVHGDKVTLRLWFEQ